YRLMGEGFEQLELRRREGPHVDAACSKRANDFVPLAEGSPQVSAPRADGTQLREIILCPDIGNVERTMLAHPLMPWVINADLDTARRYWTKMGALNHSVVLAESQYHVINPTNPCGAFDDGVEDRLHVRRRTTDDAEYLGRCRLMLQGFAQFCVTLLDLLEQPHILDGDHRLVGKGLNQIDLPFGEWLD